MSGTPAECASIRVMVVDDHALMREGIAMMLATQPDMTVVAEAANGVEAMVRYREALPDVTLMDLQMTAGNGIDAIMAIRAEFPSARIVVLTTYGGESLARRALMAGARAYILKSVVRKDLVETIRTVYRGSRFVQPEVASELADHVGDAALTGRETEVLRLVAAGNSNKRIAAHLTISEETAKAHLKSIIHKLGANDRTHAVTLAVQRGIIQL